MKAPKDTQTVWLTAGYNRFAMDGPTGLKVEQLAREVGKSKSSFYHHFADLEVFMGQLLARFSAQAVDIAAQEAACPHIDPHLIRLLLAHPVDMLFCKQLRVNRHLPGFEAVIQQTDSLMGNAILGLWCRELDFPMQQDSAKQFFFHTLEHFYLQLTPATLSEAWLTQYFDDLVQLTKGLRRT